MSLANEESETGVECEKDESAEATPEPTPSEGAEDSSSTMGVVPSEGDFEESIVAEQARCLFCGGVSEGEGERGWGGRDWLRVRMGLSFEVSLTSRYW